MTPAARRLVRLELRHAAAAIERARLLAKGDVLEPDLARLLEASRATLDLVEKAEAGGAKRA